MTKEKITDKEAICVLAIYVIGSTLIIGTGGSAKNDAWIAGILGMIMVIPMLFVYARILSLFPGEDLYSIIRLTFGKIIGNMVAGLYIWYSFHLGAIVMRNFGSFINSVTMPETPMITILLCLGLICIIAVRCGVEVIGRISAYAFPFLMFIIIVVQILAIPQFDFSNLKPILGNDLHLIVQGGFSAFAFPFAETVVFIGFFFALKTEKSLYKVYYSGVFLAGTIIVLLTIRNISVLGALRGSLYFPSHVAVSRISIGEFLQRIEITVSIVFVFGVFIKSTVCLYVACKGIAHVFGLTEYTSIVIQIGLLMTYFSYIIYDDIMMMNYWAFKVYNYYAFPFQVIIPVILLITAELKKKYKMQNRN